MGTHAMVGIWNKETEEVVASYIHYDGYLAYMGKTLVENYGSDIAAQQVALGGYISVLRSDYSRSRAESVHEDPPVKFESVEEFMNEGYDYAAADYLYLWDGNTWFFATREKGERTKFEEVEMNLHG